jgi:hypothetical protein
MVVMLLAWSKVFGKLVFTMNSRARFLVENSFEATTRDRLYGGKINYRQVSKRVRVSVSVSVSVSVGERWGCGVRNEGKPQVIEIAKETVKPQADSDRQ